MIRKLNKWLCEHGYFWGWEGNEGIVHLWAIIVSFVALLLTGIFGWNATLVCALIYLTPTFIPPILAGVIALVKKQPWTPWYWFPAVIGTVIGGILAILVCLMFGIVPMF